MVGFYDTVIDLIKIITAMTFLSFMTGILLVVVGFIVFALTELTKK